MRPISIILKKYLIVSVAMCFIASTFCFALSLLVGKLFGVAFAGHMVVIISLALISVGITVVVLARGLRHQYEISRVKEESERIVKEAIKRREEEEILRTEREKFKEERARFKEERKAVIATVQKIAVGVFLAEMLEETPSYAEYNGFMGKPQDAEVDDLIHRAEKLAVLSARLKDIP